MAPWLKVKFIKIPRQSKQKHSAKKRQKQMSAAQRNDWVKVEYSLCSLSTTLSLSPSLSTTLFPIFVLSTICICCSFLAISSRSQHFCEPARWKFSSLYLFWQFSIVLDDVASATSSSSTCSDAASFVRKCVHKHCGLDLALIGKVNELVRLAEGKEGEKMEQGISCSAVDIDRKKKTLLVPPL